VEEKMVSYFETLNLAPSASLKDVITAYRRLAKRYHPDTAGPNHGDVNNFYKIQEAYQALRTELSADTAHEPGTSRPKATPRGLDWRFEGVAEDATDVIYTLRVSAEAARAGLSIILPWKAEDACPRCLGQGHTLAPIFNGPHLRRVPCLKCQGKGVVKHNSSLRLELTPDMIRQEKVRMKGFGHYQPAQAKRGDLVVEITVKEKIFGHENKLWNS
jgi:DnaJ-class molecular chaperone